MRRHLKMAALALAASLAGIGDSRADRLDIHVRLVRPDGAPITGKAVRLVVGSERDARAPGAGRRLVTDGDGGVRRSLDAPVKSRRITLDNVFARHKVEHVAVGVELDVAGRPALFWTELDAHREGTVGQMVAYMQGSNGKFDQMLTFHAREFSWTFPDEPDGVRLSGIGAELRHHEMNGAPGAWTIDLVIEKHEFTIR